MGLFSGIGKALKKVGQAVGGAVKGAVKTVGTIVNPQNIIDVATGNAGKVLGNIANAAKNNIIGGAVAGFNGSKTATVIAAPAGTAVVVPAASASSKPLVVTKSNTSVVAKSSTSVKDLLLTAAGGAAVAIGTKIAGEDEAKNVINMTGWNAFKTWVKANWIMVAAGVAAIAGGAYFIFRKPKKVRFGRR